MENDMECPCGSGATFDACCEPVITGAMVATTAEQLMRARYTAYTRAEMDFLFETLNPDKRDDNDREGARDWAENSQWHGLEILETKDGGPEDDQGTVEFIANYTYKDEDQHYHEVATFERVDDQWFFSEGVPGVRKPVVRDEPKIGRNDPSPCGSGKKYKRCCGG
jgi:SEC-C motif-containing protein